MDKKKLFSDYLFNLLRMMLNIGLPVIVLPFVLNRIGPENYGIFSYTNSVISYFTMLAILGIPEYAARLVARERLSDSLNKTVTEIFLFQCITVSFALVVFFLGFFPFASDLYRKPYLILSILIFSGFFNVEWFYVGTQRFKFIAVRGMILKVLNVVFMLLFINNGDDYTFYALITALTTFGNSLVNFSGFLKNLQIVKFRSLDIKRHIKPVFILFSLSVAGLIHASIDKTLTGILVGPLYVGYYAIGFRLSRVVLQLFTSLNDIIYPRVTSYLAQNDEKSGAKLIAFNMDYIFMLSLPIVTGMFLYGSDIIRLLFDPEMGPAGYSLVILSFIIPFQAIKRLLRQQVLLPRDKDKVILVITFVGIMGNLILNVLLVPRYFHIGAAIATLCVEIMDVVITLIYVNKEFKISIFRLSQLKYLFATPLILIPFSVYAKGKTIGFLELIIVVIVSALIYFSALLILRDNVLYSSMKKILSRKHN